MDTIRGSFVTLLDSVAAVSTLSLRVTSYYFTRHLPLGPRFLPTIYASFAIYLVALILKILAQPRKRRPTSRPLILILGWYESSHGITSFCSFVINAAALLAAVDFVFRAHVLGQGNDVSFSRIGFVNTDSARVVIRAPESNYVQLSYRTDQAQSWIPASTLPTVSENDFVATFLLHSLKSNTRYEYQTNASHSGTFQTANRDPKQWTMVSSSCLKPGYPYNPFNDQLRVVGLEHLSDFIKKQQTEFMLFLGDFIYIDLPRRFGFKNSDYRLEYQKAYASPSWSQELRDLPFIHTYDDHEFSNDWAANTTGLFYDAVEPFVNYHGNANPESPTDSKSWFTFNRGDISFFVADTRRYRSSFEIPDGPQKTMLGEKQLNDLENWLDTPSKKWKVFVSSVPFTRNWRGPEAYDNWAGYLWEREQILKKMWKNDGMIVMSGDRHEHATTEFPSPDGRTKVTEFSTSPLSQFYQPFERMYEQIEDSDVKVNYHPLGVSKFGVFNFDTSSRNRKEWSMKFELIVDGVKAWEHIIKHA